MKSTEDKQEIIIIPFHRCVNNVPPTEQSSLCRVLGSCPKNYTKTKLICMSAVCCRTLIKRCAVANKEQCQSNGAGDMLAVKSTRKIYKNYRSDEIPSQVFKYSSIEVFKYSSIQVFKYSSLQFNKMILPTNYYYY